MVTNVTGVVLRIRHTGIRFFIIMAIPVVMVSLFRLVLVLHLRLLSVSSSSVVELRIPMLMRMRSVTMLDVVLERRSISDDLLPGYTLGGYTPVCRGGITTRGHAVGARDSRRLLSYWDIPMRSKRHRATECGDNHPESCRFVIRRRPSGIGPCRESPGGTRYVKSIPQTDYRHCRGRSRCCTSAGPRRDHSAGRP